jgi:hypothetical protein
VGVDAPPLKVVPEPPIVVEVIDGGRVRMALVKFEHLDSNPGGLGAPCFVVFHDRWTVVERTHA